MEQDEVGGHATGTMTAVDTYLGLRAFVDELVRCGLREVCTSPGSRSTPLVLSLVRDGRLRATSHIDERCGGFFALGLAKASGLPVALACTSGTAAANYAPAVIEAHEARVPLLVLTADRPPELRDVGAGQTIDQLKLYGSAAKWFQEVDAQPATPERIRWLRGLACRAYWTALDGRPGPVHLNFALREPLVLDAPLPDEEPGGGGRAGGRPWVARVARPAATTDALAGELERRPRAIVVAGRAERDPELGPALAAFAERARLPLLAEPTSGARRGTAAIAHYDALLRDPGVRRGARAGARAAGGRPADVEAAAPVAGRARRGDAPDRVRPRERLAGPGRRRRADAARRSARRARGSARAAAAARRTSLGRGRRSTPARATAAGSDRGPRPTAPRRPRSPRCWAGRWAAGSAAR